jgi:CPA2 family monovalent cation:H+ antiporter-2
MQKKCVKIFISRAVADSFATMEAMHDLSVIIMLTGALAVALVMGWITQRLGLSTLVGYILAGIIVGPHTPGFVADTQMAAQMAEIGVILLMFGVGLHFHPKELLRVWRIAVPGAVGQSAVAGLAGWAAARWMGWSHTAGIVFGMALAVASTVVLIRMLQQEDRLGSRDGHVAVGWLIVEDLFTVVALVVLPALAAGTDASETGVEIVLAIGKAAVFAALVWLAGTRLVAPVMERIARTRSAELFTLTVFVVALGIAIFAAQVFHMSVALGAFFAGLVVGQSRIGIQAAADMAPFRDVFSALFFVSIGMLFNPGIFSTHPVLFALALGIVLVVKPLAALVIVLALRDTMRTALTVSVGLAQIGEFSFILAALGVSLQVLPTEGTDLLVAAAILSIALNPLLFRALPWLEARLASRTAKSEVESAMEPAPDSPVTAAPVVVSGLGELGRRFVQRAVGAGVPVVVIDPQLERLESLRTRGVSTVFGDAGRDAVLEAAGVPGARVVVVTNPTLPEKMRICSAVRRINPRIAILAIAESEAERAWLNEFGVAFVTDVYDEMSDALVRAVRRIL